MTLAGSLAIKCVALTKPVFEEACELLGAPTLRGSLTDVEHPWHHESLCDADGLRLFFNPSKQGQQEFGNVHGHLYFSVLFAKAFRRGFGRNSHHIELVASGNGFKIRSYADPGYHKLLLETKELPFETEECEEEFLPKPHDESFIRRMATAIHGNTRLFEDSYRAMRSIMKNEGHLSLAPGIALLVSQDMTKYHEQGLSNGNLRHPPETTVLLAIDLRTHPNPVVTVPFKCVMAQDDVLVVDLGFRSTSMFYSLNIFERNNHLGKWSNQTRELFAQAFLVAGITKPPFDPKDPPADEQHEVIRSFLFPRYITPVRKTSAVNPS